VVEELRNRGVDVFDLLAVEIVVSFAGRWVMYGCGVVVCGGVVLMRVCETRTGGRVARVSTAFAPLSEASLRVRRL
jgi:hypothetical protein